MFLVKEDGKWDYLVIFLIISQRSMSAVKKHANIERMRYTMWNEGKKLSIEHMKRLQLMLEKRKQLSMNSTILDAELLLTSVYPLLKAFQSFDINSRIQVPDIDFSKSNYLFNISISGAIVRPTSYVNISEIFDLFDDSDYYEAKSAKISAKSFYEDMKYHRSLLNEKREKMREIRYFISEQEAVINSLLEKLVAANDTLQEAMKKNLFTQEEADFLQEQRNVLN